ncbi:MAG: thioredoxin family protein [Syntrophaceae bacterium]|nr:thioredoxin family protein [Syntrophaceae bacterium]
MLEWIKDAAHLGQVQEKHKDFLMLLFYADFSAPAKGALIELEQFNKENKEVPVYVIDVEKVKGVHKQFGVDNAPTVVAVKKGKVSWRIEGVESAQLYSRILSETNALPSRSGKKAISHTVVVYSGAGCPACGAAKSYLRRRGVHFRDIDISRDSHAAERLVQRSGQMAVPQIDIDGHLIVGFDQARIDRLLSN